jgi:copper(I)-binding protein
MKVLTGATIVGAALAMLLPACSGGDVVAVEDAWARSPMADVGAVYFTVVNDGGADRLVGVSAEVAGRAEIHETVMEGGQAEMQPVDAVAIPADGELAFEPGGYHVMLFDLSGPLEVGQTISVVLMFEDGGEVEVDAEVRAFVEHEMDEGM